MAERSGTVAGRRLTWAALGLPSTLRGRLDLTEEDLARLGAHREELLLLARRSAVMLEEIASEGAPIRELSLELVVDAEVPDWVELVLIADISAGFDETMEWWRRVGEKRAALNRALGTKELGLFARHIGIVLNPDPAMI